MYYNCPKCNTEVVTTDVCCWSCGVRLTEHVDFDDDELEFSELSDPEDFDDSMDGDAESALASAGFGVDEDYQHDSYDDYDYGQWDE